MTIHVNISPDAEARLRERAAAVGQDLESYAAGVLERSAMPPLSIEEISGPVGEAFGKSGMSEDELTTILEQAKHEVRAQKRAS